jgi:putative PIN family toxin of toxin-antitoxin system
VVAVRVVLDTDVLVAALRSDRSASRALLVYTLEGRCLSLVSVPLMIEYEAVITRPEHLEASRLSDADVQELLDALAVVGEPIRLSYLWRPALPDPQDDMVLETAVNGRADLLVTFNLRHFKPAARSFGLRVVTPAEALRWMEKRP